MWRQIETKRPGFLTPRVDKSLTALERNVESFPMDNPAVSFTGTVTFILSYLHFYYYNKIVQDERLQVLLENIRARYKTIIAMLGLPDAWTLGVDTSDSTKKAAQSTNEPALDF